LHLNFSAFRHICVTDSVWNKLITRNASFLAVWFENKRLGLESCVEVWSQGSFWRIWNTEKCYGGLVAL